MEESFVVTFLIHSYKKRKNSPETGAKLLFSLELEISGWPCRKYIKTAKNSGFCEKLLSENDFENCFIHFRLLWLWYQCFWGSSEDCFKSKRVSQMLLMCYGLLNSQNISINKTEKRLVTRTPPTYLKKTAGVAHKKGATTGPWWDLP